MKNVESFYPLSPMQEGMLYHTLYAPGSGAYVQQVSFRLPGAVDLDAYRRAWLAMIERHAALRTIFLWKGVKSPVQVVRREAELPLERLDWRGLDPARQESQLRDFSERERARGFDLTRAPLMRLAVVELDDAYHFVWSFHHLMIDGWSVSVLLGELTACWRDFARGARTPQLAPARPYRDYIVWLRQQDEAAAEKFWRSELAGASLPTPTPAKPAPEGGEAAAAGVRQAQQQIRLGAAETAALQAFARRHRLTTNTVAQGAWALLLSHHAGSRDVVFGATVSGRPPELVGVESMIGMFINTLPVRVRVAPEEQTGAWLQSLQTRQVESRRYEHCSLLQIQSWAGVPRGGRLYDCLLAFHNYPGQQPSPSSGQAGGGGDAAGPGHVRSVSQIAYPLEMEVMPAPGETVLTLRYDAERVDAATAERLVGGFSAVLAAAAANEAATVGDLLERLAADDRRRRASKEEAFEEAAAKKLKGLKGLRGRSKSSPAGATKG